MRQDQRILDYYDLRQLGQMYQSRGEYAKAFTFFANSATGPFDLQQRVQSLRDLAQLARVRKEYSETITVYDGIWEIYEETNWKDQDDLGGALHDLAELHRLRNERGETGELHYESHKFQAQQRIAYALCVMAEYHRWEGAYKKPIQLNTNALKISTDLGDRKGRAHALLGLADANRLGSVYKKAIPLYSEVLTICTDLNDKKGRANALWGLADVHRRQSEYEKAIPLYSELLSISTHLDSWKGTAAALWGLADVHRRQSEYKKAMPLYSELLSISTRLYNVHRRQSEYKEALPLYARVPRADCYHGNSRLAALWGLADVYRRRRELPKIIPLYCELWDTNPSFDDRPSSLARRDEYNEANLLSYNPLRGVASDDKRLDELLLEASELLLEMFGSERLMGELPTEAGSKA
ncbi:hypothetical protein FRC00_012686 [Tulasnella sp. 408]|nr:hypothetical protein FRC00_012686 [Tulasnella sp. 408]